MYLVQLTYQSTTDIYHVHIPGIYWYWVNTSNKPCIRYQVTGTRQEEKKQTKPKKRNNIKNTHIKRYWCDVRGIQQYIYSNQHIRLHLYMTRKVWNKIEKRQLTEGVGHIHVQDVVRERCRDADKSARRARGGYRRQAAQPRAASSSCCPHPAAAPVFPR